MAQLGPFDIGQIKAHVHHGLSGAAISRILVQADGESQWSETAIQVAIRRIHANPEWRGDREEGSGRPRETTKAQDRQLYNAVVKKRGKVKMTVAMLKKQFIWARCFGNTLLEERLFDAGLEWLRRRRKTIVTENYIAERVAYCEAVGRKHQSTLDTWAYNDGTVFYLDRTKEENDHTQHAALGGWVWRRSDRSDAMYQDCLAPSSYKKAQGTPVRVWGVLAEGTLYIHVLEEGEVMDQTLYEELIEDRFEHWLGSCTYLVSDFERCLRSDGPLSALKKLQVTLVEGYPRCSQDFNAIENCWKILRTRLCETLPKGLEGRDAFVERLKKAVQWINRAERKQLWYLSRNQKERCRDCLSMEPPGGRTTW